jgi:WD40 repeat protein
MAINSAAGITTSAPPNSSKALIGHTSSVWTNCFSEDGSHIATCSSDESVRVWSLDPWEEEKGRVLVCLCLHAGVVRGCDYSPGSTILATCSWDKTINVHSTSDYKVGSGSLLRGEGIERLSLESQECASGCRKCSPNGLMSGSLLKLIPGARL